MIAAIVFRANIPVAALCTFITNPFTFPAVFWAAYKIGSLLLGRGNESVNEVLIAQSDKVTPEAAITHHDFWEWLNTTITWLSNAGLPFLLGTVVLAIVGSIAGYFLVHAHWHLRGFLRKKRIAKRHAAKIQD